jgi:hypothetical protein
MYMYIALYIVSKIACIMLAKNRAEKADREIASEYGTSRVHEASIH